MRVTGILLSFYRILNISKNVVRLYSPDHLISAFSLLSAHIILPCREIQWPLPSVIFLGLGISQSLSKEDCALTELLLIKNITSRLYKILKFMLCKLALYNL